MTMGRTAVGRMPWFCLLLCSFCLGCEIVPQTAQPDRFVDEIATQPAPLNAEIVLREVPRQTPLAQARSIMEQHGFRCWSGVPDSRGTCLYCTAFKRRHAASADRIVVKLFHENRRVVNVEVSVELDVCEVHGVFFSRPDFNLSF
jgi:hypothetical protein